MIALTDLTDPGRIIYVAESHIVTVTAYHSNDPDIMGGAQIKLANGQQLIVADTVDSITAALEP